MFSQSLLLQIQVRIDRSALESHRPFSAHHFINPWAQNFILLCSINTLRGRVNCKSVWFVSSFNPPQMGITKKVKCLEVLQNGHFVEIRKKKKEITKPKIFKVLNKALFPWCKISFLSFFISGWNNDMDVFSLNSTTQIKTETHWLQTEINSRLEHCWHTLDLKGIVHPKINTNYSSW